MEGNKAHSNGVLNQRIPSKSKVDKMPDQIMGHYIGNKEALLKKFDHTAALMENFLVARFGMEFAPYVCMSDIALSDALGWGLIRTQTLADGCHHCDFRFMKGEATQISSKTPEVQEMIERTCKRKV
jgi:hypothetical protein